MPPYEVTRGFVTAETHVGGGRAAVDFPAGSVLPEDVPEEQVDALARAGAVVLVEESEAVLAEDSPLERPAKSASKQKWVAYAAAAFDLDEDTAASFSKDDLIQLIDSGDLAQDKSDASDGAQGEDGQADGVHAAADGQAEE